MTQRPTALDNVVTSNDKTVWTSNDAPVVISHSSQQVFTAIWKVLLTVSYNEDELLAAQTTHPLTSIPIRQIHYSEILQLFMKALAPLNKDHFEQRRATEPRVLHGSTISEKRPVIPFHEKLFMQHAGMSAE